MTNRLIGRKEKMKKAVEKTYKARGICSNCGRRNYPQWGTYKVGTKLTDYPCPNCGLMTWDFERKK